MESGFQPHARSAAGAWGVMQVTPGTWSYVEMFLIGRRVPRTMDGNIRVGVAYLHELMHEFRFRERKAVAAYYQGAWSVRSIGVYPETRRFVANVMALKRRFA
jgi:soluble lytic murein transglycosylase-like protein